MSQTNCPTCGAKADSVVGNCEYCGVEFAKAQSLTPQEFVTAVGRAISTAKEKTKWGQDREEAASTALMAIPIPSDIPTLTAFFMFCHGNVKHGWDALGTEQSAWRSKTKGAYDMLRLASLNNPQLATFIEEFKGSYSVEGMKAAELAAWKPIIWILVATAAIYLFVYFASK
jgi:hypothetical protein